MKLNNIILYIVMVITVSCSPIQRFNRLIERHPYVLEQDTVTIVDTVRVITKRVQTDTVVVTQPKDTIYLEKERLRVKVVRYNDTIKVKGVCQSDTIIQIVERQVPVYIPREMPKDSGFRWWKLLLSLMVILLTYKLLK